MKKGRFTSRSIFKISNKVIDIICNVLPEWRIFIRTSSGGQCRNFRFSTQLQILGLILFCCLLGWSSYATYQLQALPLILEKREQQLSEKITDYKKSLARIVKAERLIVDVTREVDGVHNQVVAFAGISSTMVESSTDILPFNEVNKKKNLLPSEIAARNIQSRLNHLNTSLQRLGIAQESAIKNITDFTSNRLDQTEEKLSNIGLRREQWNDNASLGGPFIPAFNRSLRDDVNVIALLEKAQAWSSMQSTMQRLPLANPLRIGYRSNSSFGMRKDPLNFRPAVHEGIDMGAPTGTPVYATGRGIVTFAKFRNRYGLTVDIDHGHGIVTRYAHMSKIKVVVGQRVDLATVIGLVGSTGRSTGPHLHYEVRVLEKALNPLKFISVGHNARKTQ